MKTLALAFSLAVSLVLVTQLVSAATSCPRKRDTVCGKNGEEYRNACMARKAGVEYYEGKCYEKDPNDPQMLRSDKSRKKRHKRVMRKTH